MVGTIKIPSILDRLLIILLVFAIGLISGCGMGSLEKSIDHRPHASAPSDGYTNFETEPVCPLALSDDGRYLYALNTADDRLEIFEASGDSLRSLGETTVGMRPVAIALRGAPIPFPKSRVLSVAAG